MSQSYGQEFGLRNSSSPQPLSAGPPAEVNLAEDIEDELNFDRGRNWDHHTEFAVGLDFSVLSEGMMASCGWDEMVHVWNQNGDPRAQ